ncbi:helix-turn-helix domain-containing protein [Thermoanaerobacterium sp. DL9XJH110]|uniref:helix-turn-helix domain-containing protein n=1 Tax=Thermoanaerobacterium sp. DL9XJH110 TaxID=3386643 RepID=UPI003BB80A96
MSESKYDLSRIKLERARQGKSIVQLAEEANLSPKTVMRIEHNKVIPRPQTIGKIAAALGKDIEGFIIDTKL